MHIKSIIFIMTMSCLSCFSEDENKVPDAKVKWPSNHQSNTIKPGDSIDVHNGVVVYYNGGVSHGDHWVGDYKLGKKYQCVEFVKRYYFHHLNHKMPNMWGHAVDFYNRALQDGAFNQERGLIQYSNPSVQKPKPNDLIVYDLGDPYGHVSIISKVDGNTIEVVQQNWGKTPRNTFHLTQVNGKWKIENETILGWLRK
jgi:surface antigen